MKQREVLSILRISRVTLHNYIKKGIIRYRKINDKNYDYNDEDVFRLQGKNKEKINVIYQRVSTPKQKKDLENQIEKIQEWCNQNGIIIHKIFKDIGSGIELDKRKQFLDLIKLITEFKIKTIYITYKDRLTRIQFNTFKELFKLFGTEIKVLHQYADDDKNYEREIFEEIISILHVYQMKMYSKRRKEKILLLEDEQKLIKSHEDKIQDGYNK